MTAFPRIRLLAACAAAAAGALLLGGLAAARPSDPAQELAACTPATLPAGKQGSDEQLACLARAVQQLPASLPEGAQVLWKQSQASPALAAVCHEAAHALGRSRYADGGLQTVMTLPDAEACDWGVLHGVVDAATLARAPEEEWAAAATACMSGTLPAEKCADAIGHAVWSLRGDFAQAQSTCHEWFPDPGRESCVGGVVMRMAAPLEGAQAREYSVEEIAQACAAWVRSQPPAREMDGCGYGTAFALTDGWFGQASQALRSDGSTPSELSAFSEAAARAADVCASLGAQVSLACIGGLSSTLANELSAPDITRMLCDRVKEGPLRTRCQDMGGISEGAP